MKQRVTIADVAKKAGVSATTVSRILNGNYSQTSAETTARVLEAIRELDYRPNALAKGLKQMKTQVIGVILSNLQNPFWLRVLKGIEDTCRKAGYQLMICNSCDDPAIEAEHIKNLQTRNVDGIIVNPTPGNRDLFEQLLATGYPCVFVNRHLPNLAMPGVVMNNIRGASLAVEHLLEGGRQRIAIIAYQGEITTWTERVEGYKTTLLAHGKREQDLLIELVPNRPGAARSAAIRLLKRNPRPDALLSTTNLMTLEILDAIQSLGLRIPEDVALVGYDETMWCKYLNPPLTTVRQPAYEMGEIAAKRIIQLCKGTRRTKLDVTVLEPELVVRESSRPASATPDVGATIAAGTGTSG
ncbi:LacI family transcriptional regulator [Alicyclobacillus cellulosilyticus]|uniref:LacI family transcriptional regulator n=1 Tax=Alicyclobacillus cellulosilyticus TaxID=1003997 RepID=A0A917NKM1_9BACL|nr:LacI family DNA-binding transcriptional regulator [Alicyclobacillus cellulosilyticus]GGJ08261.1 LacI family transcriptional regulator [Alicyclobacillus cellulosilyticus]